LTVVNGLSEDISKGGIKMSDYIVTCTSCGAANRIPADKEGKRGRCGTCHALLPQLYRHPQQITDQTFDAFVENYPGPVLAEFWAPW
jgi:thioredoxin 2